MLGLTILTFQDRGDPQKTSPLWTTEHLSDPSRSRIPRIFEECLGRVLGCTAAGIKVFSFSPFYLKSTTSVMKLQQENEKNQHFFALSITVVLQVARS